MKRSDVEKSGAARSSDLIERVATAIRDAMDEQIAHGSGGRCDDEDLAKAAIAVVLNHQIDNLDVPGAKDVEEIIEKYARENGVEL